MDLEEAAVVVLTAVEEEALVEEALIVAEVAPVVEAEAAVVEPKLLGPMAKAKLISVMTMKSQ